MDRKRLFWTGAILYGILLFLLLGVWRLPAEKLLPYLAEKYSKDRIVVRTEKAVPCFPPGYRFERVSYAMVEGGRPFTGQLRTLHASIGLVRLFAADLPLSFKAVLPAGGMVRGSAVISLFKGLQRGYLEVQAYSINLDEVSLLEALSNRKIRGALSGEMRLQGNLGNPSGLSGQGWFTIQKGSVDMRTDLAGFKAVPFEMIRLPFTLQQGVLILENAEMKGPMFSGTVSGHVRLQKSISNSLLELTAKLRPGPSLQENPLATSLLTKIRKGKDQIVLKLKGSFQKPSVVWGGS